MEILFDEGLAYRAYLGETKEMLKRPQVKFYKDAVPDILAGRKTIEPRPRSASWIRRINRATVIDLTYGPRMGPAIVFATAKVLSLEIRPFESVTEEDLRGIALGWETRTVEDFIAEYTRWFVRELDRGYPVAWIHFRLTHDSS